MYPRVVYYRHGFATKDVLMCDDCHKLEREFYESRLTTAITESNAHEAICLTIKEKTSSSTSIPFYFIRMTIDLSMIKKLAMELLLVLHTKIAPI
jgi:hypothetical protein